MNDAIYIDKFQKHVDRGVFMTNLERKVAVEMKNHQRELKEK